MSNRTRREPARTATREELVHEAARATAARLAPRTYSADHQDPAYPDVEVDDSLLEEHDGDWLTDLGDGKIRPTTLAQVRAVVRFMAGELDRLVNDHEGDPCSPLQHIPAPALLSYEDENWTAADLDDMYTRLALIEDLQVGRLTETEYVRCLRDTGSSAVMMSPARHESRHRRLMCRPA